jgi:excisionase family DNA binding protein
MDPLLKPRDVAARLGVSLSTVERLIADDAFSGGLVRFRGNTRIKPEVLDEFIARHTGQIGKPTYLRCDDHSIELFNSATGDAIRDDRG